MDAPTGAARWYKKLASDFSVTTTSRVQVLDATIIGDASLQNWWVRNTQPAVPVLADPQSDLSKQLGAEGTWSEVSVVDCTGKVRFHQGDELDEALYTDVKKLVDELKASPDCSTSEQ